jgi:hypothetical protein
MKKQNELDFVGRSRNPATMQIKIGRGDAIARA